MRETAFGKCAHCTSMYDRKSREKWQTNYFTSDSSFASHCDKCGIDSVCV